MPNVSRIAAYRIPNDTESDTQVRQDLVTKQQ